jgi:hypothetical protein
MSNISQPNMKSDPQNGTVITPFSRPEPLPPEEVDRIRRDAFSGVRPHQIQNSLIVDAVAQLKRIADALEILVARESE